MTVALPPLVIPERFNMARYCLAQCGGAVWPKTACPRGHR